MTNTELRVELNRRGLTTQVKAAAALGVDQRTVSRWLRGDARVPAYLPLALQSIPVEGKKTRKPAA